MKAFELRALTTCLWQNSEVIFFLQDGTRLEVVSHLVEPQTKMRGEEKVLSGAPTLLLMFRKQPGPEPICYEEVSEQA